MKRNIINFFSQPDNCIVTPFRRLVSAQLFRNQCGGCFFMARLTTVFLLFLLLLGGSALADRAVTLAPNSDMTGSIKVADDVIFLQETGNASGITATDAGSGKKQFTISSHFFSGFAGRSSLSDLQAGDKVMIAEMAHSTVTLEKFGDLDLLTPTYHFGTVESVGPGSLTVNILSLDDQSNQAAIAQYLSDINIKTPPADSTVEIKGWEADLPNLRYKINGVVETIYDSDTEAVYRESGVWAGWWHTKMSLDVRVNITQFDLEIKSPGIGIEIPLASLTLTPCIGMPVSLCVTADYEGKVSMTYDQTFGTEVEFDWPCIHPDVKWTSHGVQGPGFEFENNENKLGVFAGLDFGLGVNIVDEVKAGLFYYIGIQFDNIWYNGHSYPVLCGARYINTYHACEQCFRSLIYPKFGPFNAELKFFDLINEEAELVEAWSPGNLYDYHKSLTYPAEKGKGDCPLLAYPLKVTVKDRNDEPIKGAEVTYTLEDGSEPDERFSKAAVGYTDYNGKTTIYLPLGKYKVTASVPDPNDPNNPFEASKTVTENGVVGYFPHSHQDPAEISIMVNTSVSHVYFKDIGSGTVLNMPENITYHAGSCIVIPDTIPVKSGLLFTGWNTKPEGDGQPFCPGVQYQSNADLTLYAQWKVNFNTYLVIYNANGGDWAPDSQTGILGKDLELVNVPAHWGNHHFIGWDRQADAFEPEFPYGGLNILKNPEESRVITLYAIWSFDPVTTPIEIRFDLNGAPSAGQTPHARFIHKGAAMTIPSRTPAWDTKHMFLGWSENPGAAVAEYLPGKAYHFNKDTILYAVWRDVQHCSVTFLDSATGAVTNWPESISFTPEIYPLVNLPDTIPCKSGYHFTGWNTEKDGSGSFYAPGTVLRLYNSLTLYARWELINNTYIVMFNPNGGQSAPLPLVVRFGEDADLTGQEAVWENHTFLGWSFNDMSSTPDYPAGKTNTIRNPDKKRMFELYAVWGFHPVDQPICIHYDMNGGPKTQAPSDQWISPDSWIALPSSQPVWDEEHIFAGWSRDPEAVEAEYAPGSTQHFRTSLVLYAVWKRRCTLTFDPAGGSINGQTEPVTYSAWIGETFTIPKAPYRKNYALNYWKGSKYYPGDKYLVTGDHTFTAVWKKIPKTGDSADPVLWLAVMLLGTGIILAAGKTKKAKTKKRSDN